MEDYKKKYEEALERAKFYCGRGKDLEFDAPDIASDIFPELKESEDERIKKEIINYLRGYYGALISKRKEWIAWLEKQAEQKPAWSEEDERIFTLCALSVKTRYNDGLLTHYEYKLASLWLESLKERMKGE